MLSRVEADLEAAIASAAVDASAEARAAAKRAFAAHAARFPTAAAAFLAKQLPAVRDKLAKVSGERQSGGCLQSEGWLLEAPCKAAAGKMWQARQGEWGSSWGRLPAF